MKLYLLLLVFIYSSFRNVFGENAPIFTSTYSISGNLIIPYAELMEPFSAWYDATNKKSRIDYYGGMVKTYQLPGRHEFGSALKIAPITNEVTSNVDTCLELNGTAEADVKIQSVLPDLTGFQLVGNEIVNGKNCEVWRLSSEINDKVNNYTMYIMWKKNKQTNHKVAVPIMYEMKGFNSLFGSHYDHYYLTYSYFNNGVPDPSVFVIPNNMTCGPFPSPPGSKHHHYVATFNPMQEFIHNDVKHVDKAWDDFHKYHHRVEEYKSDKEYQLRRYVFHQNFRFIQSKNRANLGFKLAVNHLADRTSDELKYLRGKKNSNVTDNGGKPFPYSSENLTKIEGQLPDNIDWRLYGAVTPVKDQSVCGSCWSFGTTGTVEGAYLLKTGHQVRLSQQALIDCSWGFGNDGCDGGEDFQAYHWIMKHGGLPSEPDYGPYLGQDGYCHIGNMTMTAHITGFVNVTANNEIALKTALVQNGPISIAIDASQRSLSFYSSGIYYDEKCGNTTDKLDHAVLLVGYGKLNGNPYWLVKNSWSNYWGNDGYFLISPRDNNCGVMLSPTYVTM